MPLVLEFRAETTVAIEADGLVQAALAATTVRAVEDALVWHGNRQERAGEFFRISGDLSDGQVVMRGEFNGVHRLGEGMTEGSLHIDGNVGRHLGAAMRGGQIHVVGSAGDWVGAEMRDGLIHVHGNAGQRVGAAYVGSERGMRGGAILIDGDAGDQIGHTMRRGLIAVGGDAGSFAAINMIAGTVLVAGACGERPGAAMRRGTLALLGPAPELLPTFRRASRCRPLFLRVYLKWLIDRGFAIDRRAMDDEYVLNSGDHLNTGRGEILVRIATP
ncbi:MAG TPA: formylmethanofuran dehydrogenase subunit C [Pirellulales bacterium]|nr:formylmethanofuran dehydrogenase subunit C [Pirellulales bacterium]